MTNQQIIRAILDAATEGDLVKAEKVLEDYAVSKKSDDKTTIAKRSLHSMFRDWWETNMEDVGINKEDVITVQVIDGAVYVFFWGKTINQNT